MCDPKNKKAVPTRANAEPARLAWQATPRRESAAGRGLTYQPRPTPAPREVSSLLLAPPKVKVALSEIARW